MRGLVHCQNADRRRVDVGGTNKHRYVLATQSLELRQHLRAVPAVHIVHMNRSVMILEQINDDTIRAKALVCLHAHVLSKIGRAHV